MYVWIFLDTWKHSRKFNFFAKKSKKFQKFKFSCCDPDRPMKILKSAPPRPDASLRNPGIIIIQLYEFSAIFEKNWEKYTFFLLLWKFLKFWV